MRSMRQQNSPGHRCQTERVKANLSTSSEMVLVNHCNSLQTPWTESYGFVCASVSLLNLRPNVAVVELLLRCETLNMCRCPAIVRACPCCSYQSTAVLVWARTSCKLASIAGRASSVDSRAPSYYHCHQYYHCSWYWCLSRWQGMFILTLPIFPPILWHNTTVSRAHLLLTFSVLWLIWACRCFWICW
jgi:hypothetical protein